MNSFIQASHWTGKNENFYLKLGVLITFRILQTLKYNTHFFFYRIFISKTWCVFYNTEEHLTFFLCIKLAHISKHWTTCRHVYTFCTPSTKEHLQWDYQRIWLTLLFLFLDNQEILSYLKNKIKTFRWSTNEIVLIRKMFVKIIIVFPI